MAISTIIRYRTHLVNDTRQPSNMTDVTELHAIYEVTTRSNPSEPPITMEIEIGGASLEMVTYNRLWGKQPPPLKPSQLKLRTYTGEPLKTCGEVTVVVRHHDQAVDLLVVPGNGASLLGKNWMGKLRLDWQAVHQLHSLKKQTYPLAWFPELFNDDLGIMKDAKTSIHVKPDANPVFCKARTVPYL